MLTVPAVLAVRGTSGPVTLTRGGIQEQVPLLSQPQACCSLCLHQGHQPAGRRSPKVGYKHLDLGVPLTEGATDPAQPGEEVLHLCHFCRHRFWLFGAEMRPAVL